MARSGIPCGPVNSYDKVFQDPQVLSRNMVVTVEHHQFGQFKVIGIPVKLLETPAPALGEHTDELLLSLGIGKNRIVELKEKGVI